MAAGNSVDVREFEQADFDALTALWHRTNLAAYPYVAAHQAHSLDEARAFFRRGVLSANRVWVARQNGELAGLVAVSATHIMQFAVAPEYQRRGIGSALLAHVLRGRATALRLYTYQRNCAARSFYERHGFRAVAFGESPAPENEPDVEYLLDARG